MFDAEGRQDGSTCPECGRSDQTIRWHFLEGFDELECKACGYRSDELALQELHREARNTLDREDDVAPPRTDPLRA